jgi:UDP-N-acetylmuramoylalanine--D-glutamate ligase
VDHTVHTTPPPAAPQPGWLQGRRVLVLGLGASGLAMARWCLRQGAEVSVWDSRQTPPGAAAMQAELAQAQRLSALPAQSASVGGEQAFEKPTLAFELILKSPGLAPHDAKIAPLLAAAKAASVPVLGELDVFSRALAELKQARGYAPQLIAITGTNGKTTTTALTALLVQRAGRSAIAAGNIGLPMLQALADALDGDSLPQVWVLELSSFQLDGVHSFAPDAATVLNLSQDHLDWHGSMQAYAAAKGRIFGNGTGTVLLNADDAEVRALRPAEPKASSRGPKPVPREVQHFGLGAPQAPDDWGLVSENGMAWLVRALPSEAKGRRQASLIDEELHLQRLMPADALRIRGRHNAANALAALALASAVGCPLAPMLHGLREYRGEPHRVSPIGSVGGIEAFDDSKGTNVGATVAALQGLGADVAPARLALILGGEGKGQDFAPLAPAVAAHARAVALIGRDAGAIEAAIAQAAHGAGVPVQKHESLQAATAWCFEQAQPGDAVLLSPACASFDMFRNYEHRAEVFAQAVAELAAERGEVHA